MNRSHILYLTVFLLLTSCAKPAQAIPPTAVSAPRTSAPTATETSQLPTETPMPVATQDPSVFGAIGTGEIQAFALESVAHAIFSKVMDGFVTGGSVQAYQVISVTIFPGGNGLLAEIIYHIRTTDPAWLADGGSQSTDGWITGNCSRFDFLTTETEYQLKNRRLCS